MEHLISNGLLKYFSYDDLVKLYCLDDQYIKAKVIVARLFSGKIDKAGKPYIGHLLRVSAKLEEVCEKVAALLHDTIEDTDITYDDLLGIGFTPDVLEIVLLVTKEEIDTSNFSEEERLMLYSKKIDSIIDSGNIHAIRLKEADMSDNYDEERLKELPFEKQMCLKESMENKLRN